MGDTKIIIIILFLFLYRKTFLRVVKKNSTENYKVIPYITTLLSTCLWTFYGLLKPDGLLVLTVNGIGAVFQFIYVTFFLIYAPRDKKVLFTKHMLLLYIYMVDRVPICIPIYIIICVLLLKIKHVYLRIK